MANSNLQARAAVAWQISKMIVDIWTLEDRLVWWTFAGLAISILNVSERFKAAS